MKLKLLNKYGISPADRPLIAAIYGAFEWSREHFADPRCWWIDLETFNYLAGGFDADAPLHDWLRRDGDRFRLMPIAVDLFRDAIGFVPPIIGPDSIESMTVNHGAVAVCVRYRPEPTVSDGVVVMKRDIHIYHEVELGDEPASAASLRAIQEALALANAALDAWDALAA